MRMRKLGGEANWEAWLGWGIVVLFYVVHLYTRLCMEKTYRRNFVLLIMMMVVVLSMVVSVAVMRGRRRWRRLLVMLVLVL